MAVFDIDLHTKEKITAKTQRLQELLKHMVCCAPGRPGGEGLFPNILVADWAESIERIQPSNGLWVLTLCHLQNPVRPAECDRFVPMA